MFVILKYSNNETSIFDIVYSNDDNLAYNVMTNYAVKEMESLKLAPPIKYTKYVTFYINSKEGTVELIKKYKKIHPGMLFNSSEYITETVFKLSFLPFNNYNSINSIEATSDFNFNLNKEIQTRLFKQLNEEQSVDVFNKILNSLSSKKQWNNNEIINLVSDITYEYKTNKISDIIQNMKRYGDYPLPYFKNKTQEDDLIINKSTDSSCLKLYNPTSNIIWNTSPNNWFSKISQTDSVLYNTDNYKKNKFE